MYISFTQVWLSMIFKYACQFAQQMRYAHCVFRIRHFKIRLPEIMHNNAVIIRPKINFPRSFRAALFGEGIVCYLSSTDNMNPIQLTVNTNISFVTMHNTIFTKFPQEIAHNGSGRCSSGSQHVYYRSFDTGGALSNVINAIAAALHHLIFYGFFFHCYVHNVARIMYLQVFTVIPMRAIHTLCRVYFSYAIQIFESYVITLMPFLTARFPTAAFALTLWRRLAAVTTILVKLFLQLCNFIF